MIPSVVREGTRSGAEIVLFDALRMADFPGWTAFHSLNVSDHEYKRWGELDFVLLSPKGLIAIEVKGGAISCHDGLWTYTDRAGVEHHSSEGPFRQAGTGLMGLRERLLDEIPGDRLSALLFGYGVAFPQAVFDIDSVEWDPRVVLDRRTMERQDGVASWLRRLIGCWQEHTHMRMDAPEVLVEQVRRLLRPDFDVVPPLAVKAGEAVTRMERLTEEQYSHLDFIEVNERNVIEGGAGTGKTFLAIELLRREVANGRTVEYLCESPALARFVWERAPSSARVSTFDRGGAVFDGEPVDCLVVDEGQDLMSLDDLAAIGRRVRGGLESGRWTIFLDPNMQSHLSAGFDPEVLEIVRTLGARGVLRRNCRNTQEVVIQTRLLTGADVGNPMAGAGPQVEYAYYTNRDDAARRLEAHLQSLRRGGIRDADIVVLSPLGFDHSCASLVGRVSPAPTGNGDTVAFAAIREFKGLERDFVALVDLDTFETGTDFALLYVGMTRARAGLWLAVQEAAKRKLADAARERGVAGVGLGAGR